MNKQEIRFLIWFVFIMACVGMAVELWIGSVVSAGVHAAALLLLVHLAEKAKRAGRA